jgi:hypothetical protein
MYVPHDIMRFLFPPPGQLVLMKNLQQSQPAILPTEILNFTKDLKHELESTKGITDLLCYNSFYGESTYI